MENVLRTLIRDEQVSLTLIDATKLVSEAVRLHHLTPSSSIILGKALAAATFMSACLKEETGEISVTVRGDFGSLCVSGNRKLYIRGYIDSAENWKSCGFGNKGTFTVVRDDGYSRPFVGTCALPESGDADGAFEEYYRISEQLPTFIATVVEMSEEGKCTFASAVVLQPLPFADEKTIRELPKGKELEKIAEEIKAIGIKKVAESYFSAKSAGLELREAAYKCNCSREYLKGVLVSLGKEELEKILREEGEIKVHCHYCNRDYRFTGEDVKEMFP